MQARIILPETLKAGVKPDTETRLEKKPDGPGFLSFVMQEIAKQPAALVPASAAPVPESRPVSTPQPDAALAADTAAQASRNERAELEPSQRAERTESRETKDAKDQSDYGSPRADKAATETDESSRALHSQAGQLDAAIYAKGQADKSRTSSDTSKLRPSQTRLHAAFDLRPIDPGMAARVEKAIARTHAQGVPSAASAGIDKFSSVEKAFVEGARSSSAERRAQAQTKKPETGTPAFQIPAEVRENSKSREIKEKMVTVSVNPEKWSIEHEKRDLKDSRGQAHGDRRELVRDLRDSKAVRVQQNPETREGAFSEIMKAAPLPAASEPKALTETRESFSKLVERAKINVALDGSSTASMRLKPEQLGNVTLNLRVVGSQVEAKLIVESEHVKKMMKEEIEQLAVELKRQGFSVDAIEIRVREPSEESAFPFAQNPESENRDPRAGTGTFWASSNAAGENFEYGAESAEQWEGAVNLAV